MAPILETACLLDKLIRAQHKWEIGRVGASYRDQCSAVLYCTGKRQEGAVRSLHNQTMELARLCRISNMNGGIVTLRVTNMKYVTHAASIICRSAMHKLILHVKSSKWHFC